jgi:methionyl-tRNA formyltransferase
MAKENAIQATYGRFGGKRLMNIIMMATGDFAFPTFKHLANPLFDNKIRVVGLVTQPDKFVGKKRGSTRKEEDFKAFADSLSIPVFQPENVNDYETACQIKTLKPDLFVVAAYGQILSSDLLKLSTLGGINLHASLLPKYRGAMPVLWAIASGEEKTGVTIIHMNHLIDDGDMLAQEEVDIDPEETAGQLEQKLSVIGAGLVSKIIGDLQNGKVTPVKQDKSLVTKAPKVKKEDGLIEWQKSPKSIINHIRAMQPWPGAFCYLHRPTVKDPIRLSVLKVKRSSHKTTYTVPGLATSHDNKLYVSCGHEWLEITQLQPAGKKAMTTDDFLRGNKVPPGSYMADFHPNFW